MEQKNGIHTLLEETEEPRFLQTLEKFALDPAWTNATYGGAMWLGIGAAAAAALYYHHTGEAASILVVNLMIMMAAPCFGYGLHGMVMLRRRLKEHKPDIKRRRTENEPIRQPKKVASVVYDVDGTMIERHRQPKTIKYGPDRHTFSGDDLDLLEKNVLSGDLGIRRDTSAAGWGWMDKDEALGNITTTSFGRVKAILVHKKYATNGGAACEWTTLGLRDLLELDFED